MDALPIVVESFGVVAHDVLLNVSIACIAAFLAIVTGCAIVLAALTEETR